MMKISSVNDLIVSYLTSFTFQTQPSMKKTLSRSEQCNGSFTTRRHPSVRACQRLKLVHDLDDRTSRGSRPNFGALQRQRLFPQRLPNPPQLELQIRAVRQACRNIRSVAVNRQDPVADLNCCRGRGLVEDVNLSARGNLGDSIPSVNRQAERGWPACVACQPRAVRLA